MAKDFSTSTLFRMIARTSSLHHTVNMVESEPNLIHFLKRLLEKSNLSIPVLAKEMMASRVHVYQIFEGVRKPGRDMLLRIAFVLGLPIEETQRLLSIARRGALYPRVRRDAAIIFMLQHGYAVSEADEALRTVNEQPLLPSED
jgi:transcriptional regulator with XRE-family HTH domain